MYCIFFTSRQYLILTNKYKMPYMNVSSDIRKNNQVCIYLLCLALSLFSIWKSIHQQGAVNTHFQDQYILNTKNDMKHLRKKILSDDNIILCELITNILFLWKGNGILKISGFPWRMVVSPYEKKHSLSMKNGNSWEPLFPSH